MEEEFYYVIMKSSTIDTTYIKKYNREDLIERLNEDYFGENVIFEHVVNDSKWHVSTDYNLIIIKGNDIIPQKIITWDI